VSFLPHSNLSLIIRPWARIARSVYGVVTGWTIGVRFPAGTGNFSLHHRVQTGSGAHPDFYPTGTGGSFLGG
jgi:hypothetical protein